MVALSLVNEAEAKEATPEYDAGYNAFMRRCAYYALAHAGESWQPFWQVGKDDRPETADYIEGWRAAQARMHREVALCFGAAGNPRKHTAVMAEYAARAGNFSGKIGRSRKK